MEREYTVGALLVLVTIFVIASIIYFTVPEFSQSVGQIADEVFGTLPKSIQMGAEQYRQEEAKSVFESVKKCINQIKEKQEGECTCYLDYKDLPEEYYIRLTEDRKELRLEKGNLKVSETENINIEGLKFCILGKDFTYTALPLEGIYLNSKDGTFKIGNKEFLKDTPEFYSLKKDDNSYICFVTKEAEKDIKKLRSLADCSTGRNIAKENMLKFFNNFVNAYKNCKDYKGKNLCVCDYTDFKSLLEGYEIFVQQDNQKKETTFSLYYTSDEAEKPVVVDQQEGVKIVSNNIFGFDYEDLQQEETGYLKQWQEKGWIERIPSIVKRGGDRVHLVKKVDKEVEKCASEYIRCRSCRQLTDKDEMLRLLRGGNKVFTYEGKSYKEIIQSTVKDPRMQLLVASIIPVESGFNHKAMNKNKDGSVDKGVMQFNDNTAPGYPSKLEEGTCNKASCYVCHAKGCAYGDNREDPYISIPAAAQLLKDKGKFFEGYTDKELFTLAAYNRGEGNVLDAIKKTGKKDPKWEEVMKQFKPPGNCYPCNVEYYKRAFAPEFGITISPTSTESKEETPQEIITLFDQTFSKFKSCSEIKTTDCLCDNSEINLQNLPEGYDILIEKKLGKYYFTLYGKNRKEVIKEEVLDVKIGNTKKAEEDLITTIRGPSITILPKTLCTEGIGVVDSLTLPKTPFSLVYSLDSRFYQGISVCTDIKQDSSGRSRGVYVLLHELSTATRKFYLNHATIPVSKYCSGSPTK